VLLLDTREAAPSAPQDVLGGLFNARPHWCVRVRAARRGAPQPLAVLRLPHRSTRPARPPARRRAARCTRRPRRTRRAR